jgi:hypothetical protein
MLSPSCQHCSTYYPRSLTLGISRSLCLFLSFFLRSASSTLHSSLLNRFLCLSMRSIFLLASLLYVARAENRCFNTQGIAITDSSFVPCNSSATVSACCVSLYWFDTPSLTIILTLYRPRTKESVISASKAVFVTHNKAHTVAISMVTAAPTALSATQIAHTPALWRVSKPQPSRTDPLL